MSPILKAVIFCDDIRNEEGNKVSLMGVLGKQLLLNEETKLPARLPILSVYQRWEGFEKGRTPLYMQIMKDGKFLEQYPKPIELAVDPSASSVYVNIAIRLVGFKVVTYGDYHFRTSVGTPENVLDETVLKIATFDK